MKIARLIAIAAALVIVFSGVAAASRPACTTTQDNYTSRIKLP
jgi:hypothetical protein